MAAMMFSSRARLVMTAVTLWSLPELFGAAMRCWSKEGYDADNIEMIVNGNVDDDNDTYGKNQINRRFQFSGIFRSVLGAMGLMERTSAKKKKTGTLNAR